MSILISVIASIALQLLYHQYSILTYRVNFFDLIPCFCVILILYFVGFLKSCKEGYVPIVYIWDLQLFGECVFVTMRWPSVTLATSGINATAWTFPVRCLENPRSTGSARGVCEYTHLAGTTGRSAQCVTLTLTVCWKFLRTSM